MEQENPLLHNWNTTVEAGEAESTHLPSESAPIHRRASKMTFLDFLKD
jgi:hypothetical protein